MAFNPDFTTSQTLGYPSLINFVDTSTGSNLTPIATRKVYMLTSLNTYLVQDGTTTNYETWNAASNTAVFNVLTKDYALYVTVVWIDTNGAIAATKSYSLGFSLYNDTFDYQLAAIMSSNPAVVGSNNFFENKTKLETAISSGKNAVIFGNDIMNGQLCFDYATNLRLNSAYYFNANL
jgi:hypothetical protein